MKLDDFLAGIDILRRYTTSKHPLDASHDKISFATDVVVSDEDDVALRALGWFNEADEIVDGENVKDDNDGPWECFV